MGTLCQPCALTPGEAFARLQGEPGQCWLDDGSGSGVSVLGAAPALTIVARDGTVEMIRDGQVSACAGDALTLLETTLRAHAGPGTTAPYAGGAIGYFSYDYGRRLAGQRGRHHARRTWPEFEFHFFPALYVFDHSHARAELRAPDTPTGRAALNALAGRLADAPSDLPSKAPKPLCNAKLIANRSREDYCQAVERVRQYIAAGDIYQANLAQFFSTPLDGSPSDLYRRLRAHNPAPHGAYLDFGDRQILSSSPELFLRVDAHGRVLTRPIKGTRPRGDSPERDDARRAELLISAKERAELLMIVDMERNDLGRVCEFGSVRVNALHALESYATVHHLVGEIEGNLRPDTPLADLLRATLPGGSITGAPKLRAMEIIDELEPDPREVYCGALGYLGFDASATLAIAIRTITCQAGHARFGVGAGIVWDSKPRMEFEETLHKAKALFAALNDPAP